MQWSPRLDLLPRSWAAPGRRAKGGSHSLGLSRPLCSHQPALSPCPSYCAHFRVLNFYTGQILKTQCLKCVDIFSLAPFLSLSITCNTRIFLFMGAEYRIRIMRDDFLPNFGSLRRRGIERLMCAMAPHSSTIAWKIPWAEEPGRLQSMGLRRVEHYWATSLSLFTFMYWRRKWQPTTVLLPGESQGRGSLVGCRLWGRTESDTTEATWQQ